MWTSVSPWYAVSPKGDWIYALAEDGNIYCFSTITGQLESLLKAVAYIRPLFSST
jgi:hypothetical protein